MKDSLAIFAVSIVLAVGCGTPASSGPDASSASIAPLSAEDRAAITKMSERFEQAFKAGDWDTIAASVTPEAILYPADAPPVEGREAIKKHFSAFPPVKDFDSEIAEIEGYGDLAYLRGTATLTMEAPDGKEVKATGKFIEIYRKQADGSWLMDRDVYNMDAPAGG